MPLRSALMLGFIYLGAGCFQTQREPANTALPYLNIESPANKIQTTSSTLDIKGRSNTPVVLINSSSHLVIDQRFTVPVSLQPGQNIFLIEAGTGYSTTSQILIIERLIDEQQ